MSSRPLPKRQKLRQKRPVQIKEDQVKVNIETDNGTGSGFNLSPIFGHLAGFLFGSFITLSYQPIVNDPICTPFLGMDKDGDVELVGIDKLAWWKGFLVSTICDHHAKISGFLLRFGVSISGALIIAYLLNSVFAKLKQAQPQYKDKFEMEVGNETWTLRTTLKMRREQVKSNSNWKLDTRAETLEAQESSVEVEPGEVLGFLFKAIDHFGRNTQIIKENRNLESLFETANVFAGLSNLDEDVNNCPDVLDKLIAKLKEQNRNNDNCARQELQE